MAGSPSSLAPAPRRPVRGLGVLDRVDAVHGQQWEEKVERVPDVLGTVAAVVDDHPDLTGVIDDSPQHGVVGLRTEVRADPPTVDKGLILDVEADNACVREELLPHPERCTALTVPLVATDADLQERELGIAQVRQVSLVVRGVEVLAPLVRLVLLRQLSQRRPGRPGSVRPGRASAQRVREQLPGALRHPGLDLLHGEPLDPVAHRLPPRGRRTLG